MPRNFPISMNEIQPEPPQCATVETRRSFLQDAGIGTAAAITFLLDPMASAQQHDDHGSDHARRTDIGAMLKKELAHPFNQDPDQWLNAHEKEWKECFDCSGEPVTEVTVLCIDERMVMESSTQSGKRVLRVAGSGILWKNTDDFVDAIVRQIEGSAQGRDLSTINVRVSSHGDEEGRGCGAAGLQFGNTENPDQSARDYQQDVIVAKLKARGINAEFIGDKQMRKEPHTGIGAVVDCTSGRLQRLSDLNMFVVAMPDNNAEHAVAEAMLALKIAAGNHAYGSLLQQFTFVVFTDPARQMDSQAVIDGIEQQTRPFTTQGISIRIITREAPSAQ